MYKIISETEVMATAYLKAYGFEDEQISSLITQAKKDLKKTLKQLHEVVYAETLSMIDINNALHALKGLLFHMGNHTLANELDEIRSTFESEKILQKLKFLLFEDVVNV